MEGIVLGAELARVGEIPRSPPLLRVEDVSPRVRRRSPWMRCGVGVGRLVGSAASENWQGAGRGRYECVAGSEAASLCARETAGVHAPKIRGMRSLPLRNPRAVPGFCMRAALLP